MSAALEGVTVVSVEQAVAVPLATRRLAEAGARVIKVERPGGDFARGYDRLVQGECSHFVWLNRGKESVVVDFKDPSDAAFLTRVIASADVFVQNLSPGAAARAGFGSAALRERHPTLVTCDITGYGDAGPWAEMRAYDTLVQGETGLQAVTGTPESPCRVGISVCDIATGMHVYGAVLEALLLRQRTGRGAALAVSLFGAMADWMSVPYLQLRYGGRAPARTGLAHPTIAPYGPFTTADGDVLLIAVQNEREWVRLCRDVLGAPELAADPRFAGNPARAEHRTALDGRLGERFGALSTAEATERLRRGAVAFGRVNTVADFAGHEQLRLVEVDTPAGPVRMPADPVVWSGDAPPPHRPSVPALDEHGERLRAEFGDDRPTPAGGGR